MTRMVRRWYLVCLVLAAPLGLAIGCGDSDKAKRTMPGDGGEASGGGEAGGPSASGASAEPAAAGVGGDATDPGSGGNAGTGDVSGGAPTGAGGADTSSGGADTSPGGADGTGNAFATACIYPNGSSCDEISGTQAEASLFDQSCSDNERQSLDECPSTDMAGVCTWAEAGANFRQIHYDPIDPTELEEAELNCLEKPGAVWSEP